MHRNFVSIVAFCVAFRACAAGLGATQASEPMVLNVEYDVPVYVAKDAAAYVQRGLDLEAKLQAKSSLRAAVGLGRHQGLPFSALSMRTPEVDAEAHDTEVAVHVPSPTGSASSLLADARDGARMLEQLAQAQDMQEQRFLDEVGAFMSQWRHSADA